MRFLTYRHAGRQHSGVLSDSIIHPLPPGQDLLSLLRARGGEGALHVAGEAAVAGSGPTLPLEDVTVSAPLHPPTVRDFVTFEEHVEGVRRSVDGSAGVPEQWYAAPTFYFTNPYAVTGPYDDIPVPPGSEVLDFELEVAAVIGRAGTDLTPAQARDHIVGYTIFNDWSARDLQSQEMQVGLGPCKGKDTAATLGPVLVTADELAPFRDPDGFLALTLSAEINGETVGTDLLSNMSWTFEEMASYASRGTHLMPGDVLGSGTCGNGGCLAELWGTRGEQAPPPLKPGDTVTLTAEGIGTLANTIVPGVEPAFVPPARVRPRARP